MKIVDLQLNIDGLILNDDESVEEIIKNIKVNSNYPIIWQVLSEEKYD